MSAETRPPRDEPAAAVDAATSKGGAGDDTLIVEGFHLVDRGFLITVAVMTVGAAATEVWGVIESRKIDLAC